MSRYSVFNTRHLFLAALLAFCSEIVLWTNPPAREVIDWLLLALGYLALSGLLLELAARYRLRDAYGLLTLAGIYGLLNGLILNPQSALIDVPRTLITRAMGAQAFAGLLALALFLALTGGGLRSRRKLMIVLGLTLVAGVGWGTWAHWSPVAFGNGSESAPETLLIYAGIGFLLIGAAGIAMRRDSTPGDPRLSAAGWAFSAAVLVGLAVIHLLRGEIDTLSLSLIVTLSAFSIMILWFQKRKKGSTLLDGLGSAPDWKTLALIVAAFAVGGTAGILVPRGGASSDPLALIGALLTAYGLIWLPAVSLVLGARAFSRQARAMRL
ncbi:MAG: hypothetical protein ABI835_02280 [Chloroflexota bacterium]